VTLKLAHSAGEGQLTVSDIKCCLIL